ncbi:MAG: leucine-rich repeat domain-containing protein, partial [Clostridia bacterium]|nr:leucine-rich repeat domain-containing protein [Clostridia bacterium]
MKKNIIAIILLFTLTASALLPLTSCRINLLPNVQAPSDGGNGESTENGNGSSDEGGNGESTENGNGSSDEGGEEVPEEPELPVLPDLPASEGLEFETLTAEDGSEYLSVKGVGACEDRKIVIPHEHDGLPVKEISEKAFYTYRFYEEVIIPGTVEKIGDYAFCGSKMLEKVTLHTGIKTLGKNAFASCPKITEINLPSTVTRVEDTAFSGCNKLETINFPRGMEYIGSSVVNGTAWYNDYTNWDGKLLYFGEYLLDSNRESLDGVYTVKEGTRLIASHAFSSAERLYGVELPDTVEILCDLVFSYSRLVEIDLPDSIVKIGRGSFYCCYSLIRVKLSDGMNTIPDSTFMWCNIITEISIPDNVTTIGHCAFAHSGLTEITFPEKLTDLGGQALEGCTNLRKVTFNANIKKIGISAFDNCYNLTEIDLPSGITDIRGGVFERTAFYDDEDNWEDGALY